ncbi:uncharacterized protein [Lepeophtheirus salmonis]|uniref:uncharacterized protein isoform X2 n=1 Tax=Lepeophtheirus salmonis TaxID=72036 RepID=UPI003AF3B45F
MENLYMDVFSFGMSSSKVIVYGPLHMCKLKFINQTQGMMAGWFEYPRSSSFETGHVDTISVYLKGVHGTDVKFQFEITVTKLEHTNNSQIDKIYFGVGVYTTSINLVVIGFDEKNYLDNSSNTLQSSLQIDDSIKQLSFGESLVLSWTMIIQDTISVLQTTIYSDQIHDKLFQFGGIRIEFDEDPCNLMSNRFIRNIENLNKEGTGNIIYSLTGKRTNVNVNFSVCLTMNNAMKLIPEQLRNINISLKVDKNGKQFYKKNIPLALLDSPTNQQNLLFKTPSVKKVFILNNYGLCSNSKVMVLVSFLVEPKSMFNLEINVNKTDGLKPISIRLRRNTNVHLQNYDTNEDFIDSSENIMQNIGIVENIKSTAELMTFEIIYMVNSSDVVFFGGSISGQDFQTVGNIKRNDCLPNDKITIHKYDSYRFEEDNRMFNMDFVVNLQAQIGTNDNIKLLIQILENKGSVERVMIEDTFSEFPCIKNRSETYFLSNSIDGLYEITLNPSCPLYNDYFSSRFMVKALIKPTSDSTLNFQLSISLDNVVFNYTTNSIRTNSNANCGSKEPVISYISSKSVINQFLAITYHIRFLPCSNIEEYSVVVYSPSNETCFCQAHLNHVGRDLSNFLHNQNIRLELEGDEVCFTRTTLQLNNIFRLPNKVQCGGDNINGQDSIGITFWMHLNRNRTIPDGIIIETSFNNSDEQLQSEFSVINEEVDGNFDVINITTPSTIYKYTPFIQKVYLNSSSTFKFNITITQPIFREENKNLLRFVEIMPLYLGKNHPCILFETETLELEDVLQYRQFTEETFMLFGKSCFHFISDEPRDNIIEIGLVFSLDNPEEAVGSANLQVEIDDVNLESTINISSIYIQNITECEIEFDNSTASDLNVKNGIYANISLPFILKSESSCFAKLCVSVLEGDLPFMDVKNIYIESYGKNLYFSGELVTKKIKSSISFMQADYICLELKGVMLIDAANISIPNNLDRNTTSLNLLMESRINDISVNTNGSRHSIKLYNNDVEIESIPVEVLRIEEPFNSNIMMNIKIEKQNETFFKGDEIQISGTLRLHPMAINEVQPASITIRYPRIIENVTNINSNTTFIDSEEKKRMLILKFTKGLRFADIIYFNFSLNVGDIPPKLGVKFGALLFKPVSGVGNIFNNRGKKQSGLMIQEFISYSSNDCFDEIRISEICQVIASSINTNPTLSNVNLEKKWTAQKHEGQIYNEYLIFDFKKDMFLEGLSLFSNIRLKCPKEQMRKLNSHLILLAGMQS